MVLRQLQQVHGGGGVDFEGRHLMFDIAHGRGGRGQMPDAIKFIAGQADGQPFGQIVLDKFEVGMGREMGDVVARTGQKGI